MKIELNTHERCMIDFAAQHPEVLVLSADLGSSCEIKKFRATYPDRYLTMGIAEQNMAGIAAGLSTQGLIPFMSAFAVFMVHRAGDQIRNAIAHPRANVKINGGYAGLPTGGGATHSCVEDVAIMRALPNMTIFDPADARETALFTRMAVEMDGPVYLRTVRCEVPTIFGEDHKVTLGKAVTMKDGKDVTIISTGMMTAPALQAALLLEKQGISAGVLHMPTIKPIDEEAIAEAAENGWLVSAISPKKPDAT